MSLILFVQIYIYIYPLIIIIIYPFKRSDLFIRSFAEINQTSSLFFPYLLLFFKKKEGKNDERNEKYSIAVIGTVIFFKFKFKFNTNTCVLTEIAIWSKEQSSKYFIWYFIQVQYLINDIINNVQIWDILTNTQK